VKDYWGRVDPKSVRGRAVSIVVDGVERARRGFCYCENLGVLWPGRFYRFVVEGRGGEEIFVYVRARGAVYVRIFDLNNYCCWYVGMSYSSVAEGYGCVRACFPSDDYYVVVVQNTGRSNVFVEAVSVSRVGRVFIEPNDSAWKIWVIHKWVADNIRYVSDPYRGEYVQHPIETLRLRAGDCEDFAVLLTSLYRAVGLRAVLIDVDTDGDGVGDHMASLVHFPGSIDEFLEKEEYFFKVFGVRHRAHAYYYSGILGEARGVWLIADPLFSRHKYTVSDVLEDYKVMKFLEEPSV